MLGLLILIAAAFVVWRFAAPAAAFVRGFSGLLDRPVPASHPVWRAIAGRDHAGGLFGGFEVVLVFHQKRGDSDRGYLIVAMRPQRPLPPSLERDGALRESVARSPAQNAWDDLELKYELQLSCADGFLKAQWSPAGFVFFPGRFDPERWRLVLQAMHTVVAALDQSQESIRFDNRSK